MKRLIMPTLAISMASVPVMAQTAPCPTNIENINAKYQDEYDDYEDDSEKLKEMSATLDVDVDWVDTELKFDTPSVTMLDQSMTFGVPQVTMQIQEMTFITPSVTMVPKKIGQTPNVTCKDTWIYGPFGSKTKGVPSCKTTWSDIITHVPETTLQENVIKTHLPITEINDTTIVFAVPELGTFTQRIVLTLPQITVNSIALNMGQVKSRSEALEDDVSATQKLHQQELVGDTNLLFGCLRSNLDSEEESAVAQFEGPIKLLGASIETITAQGGNPAEVRLEDGTTISLIEQRNSLVTARNDVRESFNEARQNLDSSEKTAIAQMST